MSEITGRTREILEGQALSIERTAKHFARLATDTGNPIPNATRDFQTAADDYQQAADFLRAALHSGERETFDPKTHVAIGRDALAQVREDIEDEYYRNAVENITRWLAAHPAQSDTEKK